MDRARDGLHHTGVRDVADGRGGALVVHADDVTQWCDAEVGVLGLGVAERVEAVVQDADGGRRAGGQLDGQERGRSVVGDRLDLERHARQCGDEDHRNRSSAAWKASGPILAPPLKGFCNW